MLQGDEMVSSRKNKKKLEKLKENKIECDGYKKWCRWEKNKKY